ncbi:MAG: LD-carboxypeptidase [Acidobacteria bacterium]|jgi:muramoyltetrapeptide carboxypeptidase|nr:LD-carboxypeptidase [Acidobacteriota bacterium]MBF85465.1 LD-carboxypeptidase [Acidobacteriota bacterium]MEC7767809.1 LD-carboxypeptidase [Acidobacteriota bacterium]|tara:strand:+ start:813 stop:1736 length:924 start_codon:yes stop_codon:yes gene_type:complete
MLKPKALRSGDRLAVVAPASGFDRSEFELGLAELRALGFDPVYDEDVFARLGYVAGEASQRAEAFRKAWRDPDIAGLVGARGGYGSVQLLPWLPPDELRLNPKVFLGYSDLTSVLVHLTTGCGVVGFHGPTVIGRLAKGEAAYDRESLERVTMMAKPAGEFAPDGLETVNSGEATGTLLGGTLTQLVASLGTPYAFAPQKPFLLFVDEVGERPYRLDRMLTQLRLGGVLAAASAVIWGELPSCDEPTGCPTARATAADLLADFRGPVVFGFPSGHTRRAALTLPLGVRARLIADDRPRLIFEEAAVS